MSAICSCGDIESLYVYKINSNCSLILSHFQDRNTFHRFDKFNAKYNPIGESRLRWRRWDYAVTRWHRNRPNSLGRFSWRRTTLWMENTLPDWWKRCSPTWRTPSTPTWSWGEQLLCSWRDKVESNPGCQSMGDPFRSGTTWPPGQVTWRRFADKWDP